MTLKRVFLQGTSCWWPLTGICPAIS